MHRSHRGHWHEGDRMIPAIQRCRTGDLARGVDAGCVAHVVAAEIVDHRIQLVELPVLPDPAKLGWVVSRLAIADDLLQIVHTVWADRFTTEVPEIGGFSVAPRDEMVAVLQVGEVILADDDPGWTDA